MAENTQNTNLVEIIVSDHREVEEVFSQLERKSWAATSSRRRSLLPRVRTPRHPILLRPTASSTQARGWSTACATPSQRR